jgi:dihydropteroate synthase
MFFSCNIHSFTPKVMGILNVTPNSFLDGGRYTQIESALLRAHQMISEGADIIDIGGEATNPGATPLSLQEESDRVLPVIERLRSESNIFISVDTSQPSIMQAAIAHGANMINDVRALQLPNALQTVAKLNVPVCMMHMQGTPATMQDNPTYKDVVKEVKAFLMGRVAQAQSVGVLSENIFIDPGIGFGKRLTHNLLLLNSITELRSLGFPILVGMSRKAMLGELLKTPPQGRLAGSLALVAHTFLQGAAIFRVHDVKETVDVIKVLQALGSQSPESLS